MKANWQSKKLGDLLSVQNGCAFNSKSFGADGFPLIRIRDLKEGVTTETKFNAAFDSKYIVNAGDFLIGMDGDFTCHEWKGPPALLNQRVCRLQGFNDSLEPRFLFYGINAHLKAIEEVTGYTTVKHLSSKQILGIEMVVPPHSEQRRIVTLLDEAFADIATAKANAEKNLKNARELFTRISGSVLDQYASTSQSITLEDLVEPDCSLSYGIVQPGDEVAEGLHIVRPVDMNTDVVMLEGLKRIDSALANSYARTTLKGNDILLCVRGTTGTVALAHSELAGANVTRGIVPIRFASEKISHQFGYYLLRSEPAQLQIQAKTYGTALQQINIRDLRQLTLPVPAPQDQEIIVQRLSALEEETKHLTAAFVNKLTALDDLKKSLLNQAFSGFL
ncbi:MAG: restriction endonuclease subunit S [Sulfuritalea sp.]|nr:restriction endonuclease subunit S [Sulfuritalea sp.]